MLENITERKLAEDELRTERQRFQALSEHAPFGMVRIDKEGTFKYINPKFRECFGYDLKDIPDGRAWFRRPTRTLPTDTMSFRSGSMI